MLACVCQPADSGIFRKSPIPLSNPPLQLNNNNNNSKGAIPKPGRIIRAPVITREPRQHKNVDISCNIEMLNDIKSTSKETTNRRKSPKNKRKFNKEKIHVGVGTTTTNNTSYTGVELNGSLTPTDKINPIEREEIKDDPSEVCKRKEDDKELNRIQNEIEKLPDGVQLTLNELREMACRQQAQIDSQHQLLAAKEQRLRYLKEQEARQQRVQAESERLRRLRDRVDAQEMKLRKLRAIRGQVDHQKQNNISLTSDLDSIRALFNEKEKELSLAVAKVEELTRQLEELRRGRSARDQTPASALELDKLRRELMYRNKLNEQQNQRLNQQREALTARQEEMSAIDKRISELQERLHRKRLLNQQLANQISAASHKAAYHQLVRLTGSADQTNAGYLRKPQTNNTQPPNGLSRSNIAAVEPYNHVPLPTGHQRNNINGGVSTGIQENNTYHPYSTQNHHHIKPETDQVLHDNTQETNNKISNYNSNNRQDDADLLKEFSVSKSDPKYQTLPYNTKFTVNLIPTRMSNNNNNKITTNDNVDNNINVNNNEGKDGIDVHHQQSHLINNIMHTANSSNNVQQQSTHMTVHSAPLNLLNKNIATPLNQNDLINRKILENFNNHNTNGENSNAYQNGIKSVTSNESSPINTNTSNYQKPISSVAPTSVHHSGKLSNIYQTSSIKVQPVEPQTIISQKQLSPTISNANNLSSNSHSLILSPPQSNSTPYNTPETSIDKTPKPALPPKPAIKPPPRQTQVYEQNSSSNQPTPPPVPLSEPPDDATMTNQHHLQHLQQQLIKNNQKPQISVSNQQKTFLNNQQQHNLPTPHNYSAQTSQSNQGQTSNQQPNENMPIIKAKPLTIKKQPFSEQPKLRNISSYSKLNGNNSSNNNNSGNIINRKIEMPPAFHFPELNTEKIETNQQNNVTENESKDADETDKATSNNNNNNQDEMVKKDNNKTDMKVTTTTSAENVVVIRRCKKGNLKQTGKSTLARRVSFDPLALLLDASLEGELELVKKTATQVPNPSAANDEGITALHNAICAGHLEIVKFLVEFGCDVNAQDSDGWTPLHCAASCNNVAMVRFLVEHGACIFATTLSDHETAAEKCEEDEEGFDGCSEYLYSVQEKLGILSGGIVYAVFDYTAQQSDELSFKAGQQLTILRKGDESEREWWWSRLGDKEGYVPRNLLGLYPRVSRNEE